MKTPNMKVWTQYLRETAARQVKGRLGIAERGDIGFCCLGIGCKVAGIPVTDRRTGLRQNTLTLVFGEARATTLPSLRFHEWLGIDTSKVKNKYCATDVQVDWTPGLLDRNGAPLFLLGCSDLNDECDLTFVQIADVLDHFGIQDRL